MAYDKAIADLLWFTFKSSGLSFALFVVSILSALTLPDGHKILHKQDFICVTKIAFLVLL